MRAAGLGLLTFGLGVLAAGCDRPAATAGGGTLSIGIGADVTGIWPNVNDESFTSAVMSNAFEGLTRLDHDLAVAPGLASTWENPDNRTWLFTLRAGARFSDGSPVQAADVVASLDHARRTPPSAHMLTTVERVDALPDGRVRVVTHGPSATLLSSLAQAFVVPAASLRGAAPPPTTGAYAVESWSRGRELVLRRNPHGAPAGAWERVRFVVIPQAAERLSALREGRIQVADDVPPGGDAAGARLVSRPGLRVLFLALRTDRGPWADPRAREALDLALDRRELVARAFDGHATVATQLVPPAVFGFDATLPATTVDRDRARRLLAALPALGEVVLEGPRNRYVGGERLLAEVGRQMTEAGFRVRVDARDKVEFFGRLGAPDQVMYLLGWSCDGADAGNALGALLHTPVGTGRGYENSLGFTDGELDALVDQADHVRTLRDRRELLSRALARAAALRPVLPLVVQHETMALGPGVDWDPPVDMALRIRDARPAAAR